MKFFFALILTIAFSNNVFSQNGVKIGTNFSSIYGDITFGFNDGNDFTSQLKTGLRMSVFSQYGDGSYKLTIETGLSQKGYILKDELEDELGTIKTKGTFNINYLDLNSTVHFFVSDFISINAGAGFGIALSGIAKLEFYDKTGAYEGVFGDTNNAEIGEDISAFDLGLILGSTFYLNENFLLDANYYLGFLTQNPDGDYSIYNKVISISLGYIF